MMCRHTKNAEIVIVPTPEDVELITWANSNRRRSSEVIAAAVAWQQEQQVKELRKVRAIRAAGALACGVMFAIGALTAWKAGVWTGIPAWVLGGLALSVTWWL